MALGGCYNCLKYLMFVFNFIFWLIGCALLAVGIWVKVDDDSFRKIGSEEITNYVQAASWVIIVLGSIIMIIGFLGCCGAIRESQCMLATFFVFLFIIFVALLTFGIYFYMKFHKNPEEFKTEVLKNMKQCVSSYYNNTECHKQLKALFEAENCCGIEKGDFRNAHGEINAAKECGVTYLALPGCGEKLYEQVQKAVQKYLVIFVAISFGVATIMLLGMIFAMLLCCAIRETMA